MEPEEYVDSVRLRLCCAGPCEPVPCAPCQNGSLDTGRGSRDVLRGGRGHAWTRRSHHLGERSCSVL